MVDNQQSESKVHDLERLAVLSAAALLDTPTEETFDQFTRLASNILQTPVALVSLVDQDRQFFKSSIGLPDPWASRRQPPLSHSFCKHVVQTTEPLCVEDARSHPLLKDNLAVRDLGVVAYLGIPLTTSEGHTLGSFCVIDSHPRQWAPRDIEILQDLATLVIEKIELRLAAKQLQTDYLKLRNLELYRDEMVQMLVHDLRNPLTSFLVGLDLIQIGGKLKESQARYLELALEGGKKLLKMVNSLLDTNKTETGRLILKLAEVIPAQIIDTACTQMAPLAEKAGVELICDITQKTPHRADAEKLNRVLINLVSNAIQHTPTGGTIKVWVQDKQDSPAKTLQFSVADTGQGIPANAFDQIFQKFGQAETHRVTGDSTGLGLPFSRMVVEAHGGSIWVESKLGHGTSFHFTIPS